MIDPTSPPDYLFDMKLISQGAEGRVYKATFLDEPCIVKERFSKAYRHPEIDERITQHRILSECKNIYKTLKNDIYTPAIYFVDNTINSIVFEYIDGITLKEYINNNIQEQKDKMVDEDKESKVEKICHAFGNTIGKLHAKNIVHGDLTTSNAMVQHETNSLFIIDFGLSSVSTLVEDKAVDLYVLERALLSTHAAAPTLFSNVLAGYQQANNGQYKTVLKHFEKVRLRGRKRDMTG